MLRPAKATVNRLQHHNNNRLPTNSHLDGSRGCNTAGNRTLAVLQLACGEEAPSLWITVRLLGASRPMQQQVGEIQMSPARLLAGGTLRPTLGNLAPNQWRVGGRRETAALPPLVTRAGTRKMMAAAEEESGTALSRMGTALPSAPEAGVRPMEESEETSRVEEGTAG